jgi:GNAT superfamily N-acetyltransferase
MSGTTFRLVLLDKALDRTAFNSGSEPLDRYFKTQVTQDMRSRVASCYVALDARQRVAGYYTVSATGLVLDSLPLHLAKKLPRYPALPAVRLGRLAVDQAFKGQGLGSALLADALARAAGAEIAAYAMVVDAKDDAAADFYKHHGFIELLGTPLTLFLPLATVSK